MLYHLQPSTDITGGPWFSENELDVEFIEELSKITHRYILSKVILFCSSILTVSEYFPKIWTYSSP